MERMMRMSKETKKAKETKETNGQPQPEVEPVETPKDELTIALEKLVACEQQLAQAKNDYLKAYADTENTKKRLQQDFESRMKYRIQSFAVDILPVIDNLQRALNDEQQDLASWKKGIEMITNQLLEALQKEGIKEIDALHQPFDPNVHQALSSEEHTMAANTVIEVFQKGYLLKDRILRPSLVKVSEGKGNNNE